MSEQITFFCCSASTEHGFAYDWGMHLHDVWEREHRAEEAEREHAEDTAAQLVGPCEGCRQDLDEVGPLAIDGGEALCRLCRGEI